MNLVHNGGKAGLADVFVGGIQGELDVVNGKGHDSLEHVVVHFLGLKGKLGLAYLLLNPGKEGDHFAVDLLALGNGGQHHIFGDFIGAALHHDNLIRRADHGQVQVAVLALLIIGVDDNLTLYQSHIDAADGTMEGNVRNGQGKGGAQHTGDFRQEVRLHRKHRHDHGNVVAHILGEEGTDGTVHQTGIEDGLVGGTALPFDKGAGDAAHRVHLLLKVHRQGEEVDAVAGLLGSGHVDQDSGAAVLDQNGAVGKAAHLSGFKYDLLSRKFGFKGAVRAEFHFLIKCHLFLPPFSFLLSGGSF